MFGVQRSKFDFFKQVIALATMLSFSTGHLLSYAVEMDLLKGTALISICLIASFASTYHIVFRSELKSNALIPLTFFGLYCFSIFTFQGDLLIHTGADPSQANQSIWRWKLFAFGLFVPCACTWVAYRKAQSVLTIKAFQAKPSIDLWLIWIFPGSHSYDIELALGKIWWLSTAMCIFGGAVVWASVADLDPLQPVPGNLLVLCAALVLITLILHTHAGILIGENLHISAFCKRHGFEPMSYCNLDDRIKWRHDYVKYHLPAPIRALNLRLFKQHIEAYEAYLANTKT